MRRVSVFVSTFDADKAHMSSPFLQGGVIDGTISKTGAIGGDKLIVIVVDFADSTPFVSVQVALYVTV